jgi:hypothetical protein
MKFFCTVTFLSSLASVAFAREEAILARVTSYWAGESAKEDAISYATGPRDLRARRDSGAEK